MRNPEVAIKKARELSLPDLKDWKTEKLSGKEVGNIIPRGGSCVNCVDGMCLYGHNPKQKKAEEKGGLMD
jgi:hypothetical protein